MLIDGEDINPLISASVNITGKKNGKVNKPQDPTRKRKTDPEMELEGNLHSTVKRKKQELKKLRKNKVRLEKKTDSLVGVLEAVNLIGNKESDDNYVFSEHFEGVKD